MLVNTKVPSISPLFQGQLLDSCLHSKGDGSTGTLEDNCPFVTGRSVGTFQSSVQSEDMAVPV